MTTGAPEIDAKIDEALNAQRLDAINNTFGTDNRRAAARAALIAAVAGLVRDAGRYGWLARNVAGDEENYFTIDTPLLIDSHNPFETDEQIKQALDAAIDKARKV